MGVRNDFLGPDLLAAHCRYVNFAEIATLGQSGVKVANNAAIAARKGAAAPHRPRRALPPPQPRLPAHVLGASASSTAASSRSLSSSATLTSTNTRTTSISPIGTGSTCGTG